MNEYVLNRSDRLQPVLPPVINCGVTQTVVWTGQNSLQYIYELGVSVGPVDVTIEVSNYGGTPIPILGVYDGVNVSYLPKIKFGFVSAKPILVYVFPVK